MESIEIIDLERKSEIADAELAVAEDIGWAAAGFAAMTAYLKWNSWIVTILVGVIIYVLAVFSYTRKCNQANDAYQRATKTGKYYLSE
jgi:hypothetical protein